MAHPDLNELLNALLSMAQTLLTKQGEFLPFGAIMLSDGEVRHVGAKIEGDDQPGSQPLIELLTETFQKEAAKGKLRAAGICYDVLTHRANVRSRMPSVVGLNIVSVKPSLCLSLTSGKKTAIFSTAKSLLTNGRPSSSANYHAGNSQLL